MTFSCLQASLIARLVKKKKICLWCRRPWFDSWVRKIYWRRYRLPTPVCLGFPCGSASKESTCNAGDLGSISGLRRSPEEGKGCPLQLSGLENSPVCIVHGVTKSQTRLSYFHSLSLSSLQSSTTLTFLHEFFQSLLVMFKDPIPKSSGNLRRPWDLKWWKTWDFCPSSFSYFEVCASSLHQDVFHMVQA